jgi:hypothetical protein
MVCIVSTSYGSCSCICLRHLSKTLALPILKNGSIASEDEAGIFTGRGFFGSGMILMTASHGEYEFEFRGADKAHMAHNLILSHMVER